MSFKFQTYLPSLAVRPTFANFVKLIDGADVPLMVIDDGTKIVLDTKKAKESFKELKEIYELGADRRL